MSTDAEWELIDRYVAGECLPAEVERVERLLHERPDLAELVAALRATLGAEPEPAPAEWDVDAASARLERTIQGDSGARHRAPPPLRVASPDTVPQPLDVGQKLRHSHTPWFRIAAAIALVGTGALLWRESRAPARLATGAPPPARIYSTQRGQRADLRLPDGTHVVLAAESRLSVPASFDSVRREVSLDGEAFFEATHDSTKPFTVVARHGVIHDLGTRFDVRAYPEGQDVQVVVAEGKVDLGPRTPASGAAGAAGSAQVLTRGQLGRLDAGGVTTVRSGVDVERYTGWIDGELAFDDAPLREVTGQLARWYDLDISFADPALGARHVTLLLRQQPVPKILDALALVTHTRYARMGRRVRFVAGDARP